MTRCRPRTALVWVAALAILGFGGTPSVAAETVNRIVAIVNEEVITQADVASFLSAMLEEGDPAPSGQEATAMQQAALQRLIDQRLILQDAKRSGIQVAPDEILARLERFRNQFASDEAFEGSLVDSGLSKEQLKLQLHDQLMVQKAIEAKVRSTVMVSPQEVAREIGAHPELAKAGDRVRASHLLIRVTESRSAQEARALIQRIKQQLDQRASFADLAKRYSEGPQADQGGDLGWVAQGELMPELDTVIFSLQPGQVSEPLATRLGFHLVKVEERRTASSLSVSEAHRAVYQQLYQQKFQAALTRWVGELRRRAYLEIVGATR